MHKILISLVIPTYNRAECILNTIQSVLAQDYENFEILLVDDGSTDNTEEIVRSISDSRIRYFKKEHEERAIARNYGIDKSKGDYVTFLDSDDQLYSDYFSEALSVIKVNDKPEWFHLAYEIKDEAGKVLRKENKRKGNINDTLVTGNHLSCIGVFVRKDILRDHRFNEDPDIIGSEDYILWMELASNYPLKYSNRISACMVQHSGRSVVNFNAGSLIRRISKSIDFIIHHSAFINTFKKKKKRFIAHRYLYLALHLLLISERQLAFKYFWKSIKNHPSILFTKKSMVLISKLPGSILLVSKLN